MIPSNNSLRVPAQSVICAYACETDMIDRLPNFREEKIVRIEIIHLDIARK